MPLLKLETTVPLPEEKGKLLLAALSKAVAETIGKPEQYVMITVSQSAMLMSGKAGDAAFVDIRSIGGLNNETNRLVAQANAASLSKHGNHRSYLPDLTLSASSTARNGVVVLPRWQTGCLNFKMELRLDDASLAFNRISMPARAFETGQLSLASAACFWNVASSMPGMSADVSSSIRVMAKASPIFSKATLAPV